MNSSGHGIFQKFFSKLGKSLLYGGGLFAFGYFVFYYRNRNKLLKEDNKENKDEISNTGLIPDSTLEKLLWKVTNKLVIIFANLYDNSLIKEEKQEEISKLDTENLFKIDYQEKDSNRENYFNKIFSSSKILDQILSTEMEIVSKSGFKKDQYMESIKSTKSEKATRMLEFLVDFRKSLEITYRLKEIEFGEEFKKEYLKIVSNIYLLNLQKVQEDFKNNFLKKQIFFKDQQHLMNILTSLYSKHLKHSRTEVCDFFGIKNDKILDIKVLLRLYVYYLKPNEIERIRIEEFNNNVQEILANIAAGFEFTYLHQKLQPKNEIIDLSRIMESKLEISYEI